MHGFPMMTAWEYEVRISLWNIFDDLLSELWQRHDVNTFLLARLSRFGSLIRYRPQSRLLRVVKFGTSHTRQLVLTHSQQEGKFDVALLNGA